MKYVSIDIETTGLDPDEHQILEIAAIYDDLKGGRHPEIFHRVIRHKKIVGQPEALAMNKRLISMIAYPDSHPDIQFSKPEDIAVELKWWLIRAGHDVRHPVIFAGKNCANFDLPFLRRLPGWDLHMRVHHRVIDIGILYLQEDDDTPPSLRECVLRAGMDPECYSDHHAIDDARAVVDVIHEHMHLRV